MEPIDANYDEDQVPAYTLPDPLVLASGEPVVDAATWTRKRRPEILQLFKTHVYGEMPSPLADARWEIFVGVPTSIRVCSSDYVLNYNRIDPLSCRFFLRRFTARRRDYD